MSNRGTGFGSSRPLCALTVRAALVLGALSLVIFGGGIAQTVAADNDRSSPPADGGGPQVEAVPDAARTFIADYCTRCHNEERKRGNLVLKSLTYDPADAGNFALWVKVHDRVAAGEMPPEDVKQPEGSVREAFAAGLADTLVASERRRLAGEGRATQRRMNRFEYENALRDLLGVPTAQIATQLPQDGEAHRYNKSAEALDVSFLTMQRFVSAADFAMRTAISQQLNRPAKTVTKLYARDEPSLTRSFRQTENGTLSDRLSFPVLDSRGQQDVRLGAAPLSSPQTREREAVGKVSSIFSDAGRYGWSFRAPATGQYLVKLAGYTIWVGGGGIGRWFYEGQGAEKAPVYHLPLWHRPELDEVWPGRNDEPIGVYATGNGQTRPVAACDFTPRPGVCEMDVTLVAGEGLQTDAMRLFRTRVNGTDEQYVNPLATEDGIPGYAVQWMQVEGPFYDEAYGSGYQLLFGDLPLRRVESGKPGVSLEGVPGVGGPAGGPAGGRDGPRGGPGGGRGAGRGAGGAGGAGVAPTVVEVDSANPNEDAARLLRGFM